MFFKNLFIAIKYAITALLGPLRSVLPVSPVQEYVAYVASLPYLGYINWFCPIGTCVTLMRGWLVCISLYYAYLIVLRWIKAIK